MREIESEREKALNNKSILTSLWSETSKLSFAVLGKKVWPKVNRLISRDLKIANLKSLEDLWRKQKLYIIVWRFSAMIFWEISMWNLEISV